MSKVMAKSLEKLNTILKNYPKWVIHHYNNPNNMQVCCSDNTDKRDFRKVSIDYICTHNVNIEGFVIYSVLV